ncbi:MULTISPECIES: hypothetical protein [Nocardia]|uniref:hypothetical protein n=1 Tax=Nocardia TaxID=1817 RepID=UPI002454FA09|nr:MULTISPECIES: hypothetical protein [Nocardia]
MTGHGDHAQDAHPTPADGHDTTAADPCGCPASARSVPGGVQVRHHPRCLHGEPRRYLWCYAGALPTGSLADCSEHFGSLDPDARRRLAAAGDELRTWTDH